MRNALTSIVAAGALVAVVAQAADAGLDRSLPTKHSRAQIAKAAHATKQKTRRAAQPGVIVVSPNLVCPEQELGDSGVYCAIVSPGADAASDGSMPTVAHYNDTAGT